MLFTPALEAYEDDVSLSAMPDNGDSDTFERQGHNALLSVDLV